MLVHKVKGEMDQQQTDVNYHPKISLIKESCIKIKQFIKQQIRTGLRCQV